MGLQDLTPQLRTRLTRVERAVGVFVIAAALLLFAGFAYYLHHTAARKGWFVEKVLYSTSLNNATGIKVGDPVRLMGFEVGEVTRVEANDPWAWYGVTVFLTVRAPYYGYLWTDSRVKVAGADFLGNRSLEVVKGREGIPTVLEEKGRVKATLDAEKIKQLRAAGRDLIALHKQDPAPLYKPVAKGAAYWIEPDESVALTERLEALVTTAERALPDILSLTNRINEVLTNGAAAAGRLDLLLSDARPVATNLAAITGRLREPRGSLGEWLLPTNLHLQIGQTLEAARGALTNLDRTLATADRTVANTDTNLTLIVSNLNRSLDHLAGITGNLRAQADVNTNILSEVSAAIVHTDQLVQGLKRHWLLRSAFKGTNRPPPAAAPTKPKGTGKKD